MNTKSLLTRIAVPVLSLGLLGGLGASLATAGPASAATMASMAKAPAPKPVTATTHSPNHYDTTDVATGLNEPGGGGPLWAYDNLHETFTAVPDGNTGNWAVTIKVTGTFDGFASPTKANTPEHNQGTVTGSIYYYVHSANTPKAGLLPKQLPPYTGLSAALSQLFGGDANVTGGGNYAFYYNNVDGVQYVQQG